MTRAEKPLPSSMLDMASASPARVHLCLDVCGAELSFFTPIPGLRLHGLRFSATEAPCVVLGSRKMPVEGVY